MELILEDNNVSHYYLLVFQKFSQIEAVNEPITTTRILP